MRLVTIVCLACLIALTGCGGNSNESKNTNQNNIENLSSTKGERAKKSVRVTIDGFKQFRFGSSKQQVIASDICTFATFNLPYIGVESLECLDYSLEDKDIHLSLLFVDDQLTKVIVPSLESEEVIVSGLTKQFGPPTVVQKQTDSGNNISTLFAKGAVKNSKNVDDAGVSTNSIVYSVLDFQERKLRAKNKVLSIIKDNVYNFDKTMTIGTALDSWHGGCKNIQWDAYLTKRNVKVIEYNCGVKNLVQWTIAAKKYLKNEQKRGMNVGDNVFSSTEIASVNIEFSWSVKILKTVTI